MCKCNKKVNNNCGCRETTIEHSFCNQCTPPADCSCPVLIKSSCVNLYDGDDLECSGIEKGLPLNDTIKLLDEYVCTAISQINASINLINIGSGAEIYEGIDGVGKRQIRKINNGGSTLTKVTQNTEDISITIDEENLITFVQELVPSVLTVTSNDNSVQVETTQNNFDLSVEAQKEYYSTSLGTGVQVYKDTVEPTGLNEKTFRFKSIKAKDTSIEITELNDEILIKSTGGGGTPTVTNPQKRITGATYTLLAEDFGVSLIVDNDDPYMEIYVPTNLPANFITYLVQMGQGDVVIFKENPIMQVINTPIGMAIKGQFYHIAIERILNTQEYNILGNTKIDAE